MYILYIQLYVYGLKQASRAWRKQISSFLASIGASEVKLDSTLYVLTIDGNAVYILVYVDDILMLAKRNAVLKKVARLIAAKLEVRIEERVSKFLGMIIEKDPIRKTVKIHSSTLIQQMLERFGMKDSRPVKTPLSEGTALSVSMGPCNEGEKSLMERTPYRQLVGCILHLANTTRPDIAFAASYLSRFMSEPGPAHWKAAKHVLNYLEYDKTWDWVRKE